ncbi:MAG: RNA polymerase sigma factor [Cyclobacteriaceae bacterium]
MNTFFESQIWPLKNRLYRTAYLWLKDRDAANDAVQEVFSKAWVNRKLLEQRDNPTGWLVKTLKNQVLQQIREAKKMDSLEKVEEAWIDPEEETVSVSHSVKMVFCFLKDLPEKQREVFQLREVEGLTYEEIADYLEIPQEQVKVNLHRARKKLREFLLNRK